MKYLSIVLGLAAVASAIDVYLDGSSDCQRVVYICNALEPDTCCGAPSGLMGSVAFYGVPTNWNIEVRGHSQLEINGARCGFQKSKQNLSGGTYACLTARGYTGGGWGFLGKKRDAAVQNCTSWRRPDVFVLEDQTKYNIADMEDSLLEELIAIGTNGTAVADVPELFQKFEIAAQ